MLATLVLTVAFFTLSARATDNGNIITSVNTSTGAPSASATDTGYTIQGYDILVDVGGNNVLNVTEKITADFTTPTHGIYRDIPVVVSPTWVINGATVRRTYNISVTNVSVTDASTGEALTYQKIRTGDNLELKIGDPNVTLTGAKTYLIKYSYGIGNDGISQFDELYYNIIGNEWRTTISNATFTINMPKAFDKSLLSFTSGMAGSTDSSAVSYAVTSNTVKGSVNKTLQPLEGLTVRLELPNGYFSAAKSDTGVGLIIIFSALMLLSLLFFILFGRDKRVYPTVEVRSPDDLNPAEAGYIIDGIADNRDVISLIIYWADRGYISIASDGADNFTLKKLKTPGDEVRSYEKLMFDKMFDGRNSVTASDLQYSFYQTMGVVKAGLANSFKTRERQLYTASGNLAKGLCYVFAGLCTGIMLGRTVAAYEFSFSSGLIAGGIVFVITLILASLVGYAAEKSRSESKVGVVFAILFYFVVLFIIAIISAAFSTLIVAPLFDAVAAAVCGVAGSYSKKRTSQSNLWLGKLLGFKNFIRLAEKSRIEVLVKENPSLFYNVLPYAYALGVTDKWAKQFESIALAPPTWFYGNQYSMFNAIYFTALLNHNMNVYQNNMVSTPRSSGSSGGGFGGGGFSGGGFGGGGGGSW